MRTASSVLLAIVLLTEAGSSAHAQATASLDAGVGLMHAYGYGRSNAHDFSDALALDLAYPGPRRVQFTVGATLTDDRRLQAATLVTAVGSASSGQLPEPSTFIYVAGTAGVRYSRPHFPDLEFRVGYGSLRTHEGRTFPAPSWSASAHVRATAHIGLVLAAGAIQWVENGDSNHAIPVTIGIRIQ